jgi:hypothetical protein
MERLRDQGGSSDPTVARAADLLSAMPPIDAERMGRPPRLPPPPAVHHGAAGLRLALVGAITLATVIAAAAGARRAGLFGAPRDNPEAITAVVSPAAPHTTPALPQAALAPGPARVESAGQPLPSSHRTSAEPREVAIAPSSGESILMVQAVRALRHDNDPTRAQALAEEALRRYPRGPQVEEAMVLSMEAAAARGDASGAQRAAERYLARFPAGRFADRARHVLGGS